MNNKIDLIIFEKINQFADKWMWIDGLAIFFAKYFEYFLLFFLFLFLLKNFKKYKHMIILCFCSAFFSRLIITEIIRYFYFRSRPFIDYHINLLLKHSNSASFPSGHAAFYFAIATIVYFYNKKFGVLFFLASFLISFARVFSGIHWPSDILFGALIGIFSAWLISKIIKL